MNNEYYYKYDYDLLILPDTGSFLAVTEVLKYLKWFLFNSNIAVVPDWPGDHVLSVNPAVGDASAGELLDEDAAKPGPNLSSDHSRCEGPGNVLYKEYFEHSRLNQKYLSVNNISFNFPQPKTGQKFRDFYFKLTFVFIPLSGLLKKIWTQVSSAASPLWKKREDLPLSYTLFFI